MKLMTRDTDYAVRAILFIARQKEKIVSVPLLVKELEIPRPFLRKILQRLNATGVLKSYKGQGGGFSLNIASDRIFLTDLIEIFQGPLTLNECIFKKRLCPRRGTCILKKKIDGIEEDMISRLKFISIRDLLKGEGDGNGKKKNHQN